METRTQDQAALREQLGAGADTHAGSVELLRRRRDGLRRELRQANAELHRATEQQRWDTEARARVAMGNPPSSAVIARMVEEIGRARAVAQD